MAIPIKLDDPLVPSRKPPYPHGVRWLGLPMVIPSPYIILNTPVQRNHGKISREIPHSIGTMLDGGVERGPGDSTSEPINTGISTLPHLVANPWDHHSPTEHLISGVVMFHCLVASNPLKNMKVNWDDPIPNIYIYMYIYICIYMYIYEKTKQCSKAPPTSSPHLAISMGFRTTFFLGIRR